MNISIDALQLARQRTFYSLFAAIMIASCYSPEWLPGLDSNGSSADMSIGSMEGSLTASAGTGAITTSLASETTMGGTGSTSGDLTTSGGSSETNGGSTTFDADSLASEASTANVSSTTAAAEIPASANLILTFSQVKRFDFEWGQVADVSYYQLYEQADLGEPYKQILEDFDAGTVAATAIVPLHFRSNARYILRACNQVGCSDSNEVAVKSTMIAAVGYFKASNTDASDEVGSLALSADGNTLAIGARSEASSAMGIGGDQLDNAAPKAGAVYVFSRAGDSWSQEAYIKASNSDPEDSFGGRLSLSADGNTLAVGAKFEDSSAKGVNGDELNNDADDSGAAYVFTRVGDVWTQQAYLKASNSEASDNFGYGVSLAGDGNTLAVGSVFEDSKAPGVNGDEADNSTSTSGAVYVFSRAGDTWSQEAYVKASNPGAVDAFGYSVSLSSDGNVMAVGASFEDCNATGIDGDAFNEGLHDSGAAYVFTRSGGVWSQQSYVKASNAGAGDHFGYSVSVSGDGKTLAVSAEGEDSDATGINGNQLNNDVINSAAVFVFIRSGNSWAQQAYVKSSNPGTGDYFGEVVVLNHDGDVLAVCAHREDSGAQGINGVQGDESAENAGAAYVFRRTNNVWSQKAYVKAPNSGAADEFGCSPGLSGDGLTMAVGAAGEASYAVGIGGNQSNNSWPRAGAIYLF